MKTCSWQRILTLLLALVMVFGCGAWGGSVVVARADEPEPEYLVDLDFEDVREGQMPENAFLAAGTDPDAPKDPNQYYGGVKKIDGNKVLVLRTGNGATSRMHWYYPIGEYGTDVAYHDLTLTYSFARVSDGKDTLMWLPSFAEADAYWSPLAEYGFVRSDALRWINNHDGISWRNVTSVDPFNKISHQKLQWHQVKMVYSKNDDSESTADVKIYIDGVLTNIGLRRDDTNNHVFYLVTRMNAGEIYIDNIRVTEGIGEDGTGSHEPAPLPGEEELDEPTGDFINLNFEDLTDGSLPKGGTLQLGSNISDAVNTSKCFAGVKTINGNKLLALEVTPGTDSLSWRYTLDRAYKKVTMTYHIARANSDYSQITYPTIAGTNYDMPVIQFGVSSPNGRNLQWYSQEGGWNTVKLDNGIPGIYCQPLQWQEVKIEYEVNEEGTKANAKVYVDGALTNTDVLTSTANTKIHNIIFKINGAEGGAVYIDNLRVTAEDHESAEKPAALKENVIPVTSLKPSVDSLSLPVGGHGFVTVTAAPANADNLSLVYTSSNPEIATVDNWGEVIGIKAGTAVITAVPADGLTDGLKLEIPVTVTEKAGVMQTIYVSNEGGGDGSSETSRCTLKEAMAKVSAIKTMTGDVVVSLAPGYYQQTETLKFNESHGGKNHYYVIYKAEGEVTIGGKKVITGWTDEDGDGIYSAPASGLATRHLYVNNIRAVRARSESGLDSARFLSDAKNNNIGYICNNTEIANYAHPEDLEFVYLNGWYHSRCGVSKVALNNNKAEITMATPGFNWISSDTQSAKYIVYYENALELLDEPGEWYLDTHDGVIYYMPRSWEDMNQVEISAPVVEDLVWIEGADYNNMVQNIQFEGITFADTTWNRPTEVKAHNGNQNNYLTNETDSTGKLLPDRLADAAVTVKRANSVNFVDCTFTRLGIIGLKMVDGVQNSTISGNRFYDISGSAVTIGEPNWMNQEYTNPSDPRTLMKNCDVLNNYIHSIGVDYPSSAAISLGFGADMDFSHNEIFDVPYSGIHVGYGWGADVANVLKNLKIEHNFIHDTMIGEITDGGAIYTNGLTGGTEGNYNVIADNWIRNSLNASASLYADAGRGFYEYLRNVIDEADRLNLSGEQTVGSGAWFMTGSEARKEVHHLKAFQNYITVDTHKIDASGEEIQMDSAQVCDPADYPEEAQKVIDAAGLQDAYSHLQNGYAERVYTNFGDVLDLKDVGDTYQITVNGFDGKDYGESSIKNVDLKVMEFSVKDTDVATVSNTGLVTAQKTGSTTLRVTVLSGTVLKVLEYPLYVSDNLVKIVVENSLEDMVLYTTDKEFEPIVFGVTETGRKVKLHNVVYKVANTDVVKVKDGMKLHPVSVGKTVLTITGTYFGEEITVEKKVSVEQNRRFTLHNLWEMFDKQYKSSWDEAADILYGQDNITKLSYGCAKFAGRKYGNELLSFALRFERAKGAANPWISIRSQEEDGLTTSGTGYVFVFGDETGLELHRFNNGVRTQIYGDLVQYQALGGAAIKGKFTWGQEYDVEVGALTEENGVRLILRINGEEVINFLDDQEGAITAPGYFDINSDLTATLAKNTSIPDTRKAVPAGNGQWDEESNEGLSIAVDFDFADLPILVDGKLLDSQDYSVNDKGMILSVDYLKSLSGGAHSLEIMDTAYGENVRLAYATFTTPAAVADVVFIIVAVAASVILVCAVTMIVLLTRKRKPTT